MAGNWAFLSSDLDTRDKNFAQYAMTHGRIAYIIFILACVICAASFVVMIFNQAILQTSPALRASLVAIAVPSFYATLLYVIGFYLRMRSKMNKDFAQDFANIMGYSFADSAPMTSVQGDIFRVGHGNQLKDALSGVYENHPLRIYEYQFTVGYGKSSRTFVYTLLEIRFDHVLTEFRLVEPSRFDFFCGKYRHRCAFFIA
jgi:hypothetical protein